MEKEGMLKYVENTKPGDRELQRITNQKDERLVKEKNLQILYLFDQLDAKVMVY
jgi:hypothetical protein